MSESISVLPEPELEFGLDQSAISPHDGLALYGPYDSARPHHPATLSYGLVGTEEGIDAARRFFSVLEGPIQNPPKKDRLWPQFPGFEAAFGAALPEGPSLAALVDRSELELASRHVERHERAAGVVDRYIRAIEGLASRDERVQTVVCVVPDFVHARCRPESHVEDGVGERISLRERNAAKSGQGSLFGGADPRIYQMSEDFRRQLKARVMKLDMPVQIIRESTLAVVPPADHRGARTLTPLSDRAWNLGVALYYKAGAKPWRIRSARRGVCYVGLAYRRQGRTGNTACCAAQLFVDSGDGVVFRGRFGPWWSEERRECHLKKDAAAELLAGVLETYRQNYSDPIEEIFLHCRSGVDREEWEGFRSAVPSGVRLVAVRVRPDDRVRLLRDGRLPVLRGTMWRLNSRRAYLWGSGYKERLATYDGAEIPIPLAIEVQRGDANVLDVAADLFGLTKLNYNACRLGESEPVTIKFSDQVGEILVSNPKVEQPKPHFRFYI
jgi:hypothetical protein